MIFSSPLEQSLMTFFSLAAQNILKPNSKILVGCSSGPDSVALVCALKNLAPRWSFTFMIGHINHRLRGQESEKDALFVRRFAKTLGWAIEVVRAPIDNISGNLEEKAREERYAALFKMAQKHKCKLVLVAHTLDDQAETVMMNLLRGAGPDGLSGIWPLRKRKGTRMWLGRPFLGVQKKDILKYIQENHLKVRSDRSNFNMDFFRNWLRRDLFPQMEKRSPGFQRRMAQLAEIMRGEQSHWTEQMTLLRQKLLTPHSGGPFLDFKKLLSYSAAVQRRFLRAELGEYSLTFDDVESLRRWMSGPPTGGRQWQLRKGWVVERLSRSQGAPSSSIFWFRKSRFTTKIKKYQEEK